MDAAFLLGTYAAAKEPGIFRCILDGSDGRICCSPALAGLSNPTCLLIDPDRRVLYATQEDEPSGLVTAIALEARGMRVMNARPTDSMPCHLAMLPDRRHLLVSNYMGGSLEAFPLADDGSIGERSDCARHTGRGTNPERQEAPHVHSAWVHHGLIYAVDLGLDAIVRYRMDEGTGKLQAVGNRFPLPKGSGPRHLCFHGHLDLMYVLCELDGSVQVLRPSDGETLQRVALVEPTCHGGRHAAAVKLSEDGRFLLATDRSTDTIVSFAVHADGLLERVCARETGGREPRDFAVSGGWILSLNQTSGTVTVLAFDPVTGRMEPTDHMAAVPSPTCIIPYGGEPDGAA